MSHELVSTLTEKYCIKKGLEIDRAIDIPILSNTSFYQANATSSAAAVVEIASQNNMGLYFGNP